MCSMGGLEQAAAAVGGDRDTLQMERTSLIGNWVCKWSQLLRETPGSLVPLVPPQWDTRTDIQKEHGAPRAG